MEGQSNFCQIIKSESMDFDLLKGKGTCKPAQNTFECGEVGGEGRWMEPKRRNLPTIIFYQYSKKEPIGKVWYIAETQKP